MTDTNTAPTSFDHKEVSAEVAAIEGGKAHHARDCVVPAPSRTGSVHPDRAAADWIDSSDTPYPAGTAPWRMPTHA